MLNKCCARGYGPNHDAAIFYPFYRLTPGPPVTPHACFSSEREQLSCLTNAGFTVIVLLPFSSFLLRAKNDVPSFNLPLWLSGLDTHQSREHPWFNPRRSLEFFYNFFCVTYFILVLKRKTRNRRIEQERKKGEKNVNRINKE
jgi:hypothetical protein